jgi:hypothetical protein
MIRFDVNTIQVDRLQENVARLMGQYEWIAARAMTKGAIAAKTGIGRQIFPMIEGGPTAWTRRGLIAKFAKPNDLTAMAGFQYGEGNWEDSAFTPKAGGIPAGRYMGINARGGDRRPKAFELRLRRAGLIRNDQFVIPNGDVLRLNAQGNLPAGQYTQVLSRLRALEVGNAPRGPGSRGRSGRNRRQLDYFIMRYSGGRPSRNALDGEPAYIAKRIGRGFAPAFFLTDQPNYERRFPIQQVATREFANAFAAEFKAGVERELARRAR